jgi:predicted Zn-dependent protease
MERHKMVFKRKQLPGPSTDEMNPEVGALMTEVSQLLKNGQAEQARQRLDELLERFPLAYWPRVFASAFYLRAGQTIPAMSELAVALAIEPTNPLGYRRLGLLMRRGGQSQLAERILENGWQFARTLYRRDQLAEERQRFFAESDADLDLPLG